MRDWHELPRRKRRSYQGLMKRSPLSAPRIVTARVMGGLCFKAPGALRSISCVCIFQSDDCLRVPGKEELMITKRLSWSFSTFSTEIEPACESN